MLVDNFLGSLVQSCCGDGGMLQTNITGVCGECSQCLGHTGFAPSHGGVCAFPVYTAQALGCSAGNCLKRALGCMYFPGLSCSGSGIRVVLKGAGLDGPAFSPFPRLAPQVTRRLASVVAATHRLPRRCCSVFRLHNWRIFSGGCRLSRIPRSLG